MLTQAVTASHLSYSYPDGTRALEGVSLDIREREKVAIIGPNGSGKSTLLTLFNGVRRGGGEIKIFNLVLNRESAREIKRQVGLVFQNPDDQLFCPTIFEDVAFGPLNLNLSPDQVKDRVSTALRDVGLEGYEKRSSFHLSFGERKLASIATVIAMDPRIIVLDEPTSNLDLAHRRKIIRWLQENRKTIILTSHDLDMVLESCSRVIVLNRGKIVVEGKTREILSDPGIMTGNDLEIPLKIQYQNP